MNLASHSDAITSRIEGMHEWAGKQLRRATKFIRSTSMSTANISEQIQASDGYFFEQFVTSSTPMATSSVDTMAGDDENRLKDFKIDHDPTAIEDLYVEALYTILNKVGKCESAPGEKLCSYVQRAFQINDQQHKLLLARAHEEKPPVVLLNIHLLEARDLIAKDVNGFSDPFSMMGVVPCKQLPALVSDTTLKAEDNEAFDMSSVDQDCPPRSPGALDKPRDYSTFLHRFGGSFRRTSNKKKKDGSKMIPAKLIKASSVQRKTLNPKWNEKFQFVIDDVSADQFHMDIWDHDDEEKSVMDAVASLNHLSSLKGLGRFFKEVTQSARTDNDECTDDFLGCITLAIRDIPSTGVEDWFTLEKRSERSKVSGQVKLKLWLSTKEERNEKNDDVTIDLKQHVGLIQQFALHQIRQSNAPISAFHGALPDAARTILHQHAIQGDLIELHETLCAWLAYASMLQIGVSYSLLHDIFSKLISSWEPLVFEKDVENMLADSLHYFDYHSQNSIINHRNCFSSKKRENLDSFSNLLKCFKLLRESLLYMKYFMPERCFDASLTLLLQTSAEVFFKKALRDAKNEDPCVEFYRLLNLVNSTCTTFSAYNPMFRTITNVDYASVTHAQFSQMFDEYLCSEMMSENACDLKRLLVEASNRTDDGGKSLSSLIKIHLALNEFRMYSELYQRDESSEDDLGYIFDRAISRWVDLIQVRAFARVDLACQLDADIQISNNGSKQSSSYMEVCHIFEQTISSWERMRVSNTRTRIDLITKIVQSICKTAEFYVDRILAQLAAEGFHGDLQVFLPAALVTMFCSIINNAEQARRGLMVHSRLRLDELSATYYKSLQVNPKWKQQIEQNMDESDRYISGRIDAAIQRLSQRLQNQLKKHIFHLAWSPSACPVENAIKPLTDTLDAELSVLHRALLHRNFLRVMLSQFNVIIPLMQECVDENPGLDPIFYNRLSDACAILVDFFHASGKGISLETFERMSSYQTLYSKLQINQTTTPRLIEQYYQILLKEQNDANECKYGLLNVRAYYNTNSQALVIDVIGAKQVIPLDSNGLSDPFVIIELVPRMHFSLQPIGKTRVVSKSLNPIFDETFEFHISNKVPACAMVHFIVMDHDFLRSNDFAGEAFLDLADVPGIGSSAGSALRQFNLILIHPSSKEYEVTNVLTSRKDDKNAQEFIRTLNISH